MPRTGNLDVVLWGATGFTGQLVAEYFASSISKRLPTLRWAISGRNAEKLEAVRSACAAIGGTAPEVLRAASDDVASVERVVSRAKVVLSTAGPFERIGAPLVDACVRLGTDYVDINGEVAWHKAMIERYDGEARKLDVLLVPCCGFDSIPSDLGVQFVVERCAARGSPAKRVECYAALNGSFSGGTVLSGILGDETHGPAILGNPYALGGAPAGGATAADADPAAAEFDVAMESWTAPFGMAMINSRVVRRSVGLYREAAPADAAALYAGGFGYRERALVPTEEMAKKAARAATAPASKRRELVAKGRLPSPGEGPSKEQRENGWFNFTLRAEPADGGPPVVGTVSGGEPGYDETSKMVSEAAVLLATQRDALPGVAKAGFATPATAFGAALRERLHAEGIRFELQPESKL